VEGRVLCRKKESTAAYLTAAEVIDGMCRNIVKTAGEMGLNQGDMRAVSIAVPGPLDYIRGVVEDSPNLRWSSVSLRDELSKRLGYKLLLEKDTNMAVLGEWYFGQARTCRNILYITVSTGIGGGMIIDNRLYRGMNGGAGEVGHMVIDPRGRVCGCGRRGCLEAMASGTAIARQAQELIDRGSGQAIKDLCGSGKEVTAWHVGEAARRGDREAGQIISCAAQNLGSGIASLVNIINPERVILGGGVINGLGDLMFETIKDEVKGQIFRLHSRDLHVGISTLGEDIGLLGCAAAVLLDEGGML